MKKIIKVITAVLVFTMVFVGCNPKDKGNDAEKASFDTTKDITVISREEGSGTRGAFVELFKIKEKNSAGEKIDNTIPSADITQSTGVMMTSVADNDYSIGYISLGSLNDTVKALKIGGADATVENIKSGDYKISRPFNIATKGDVSKSAQDFINYIMSKDGQKIVEDNGYISKENTGEFESNKSSGKVTISGSSSVTPVMEKLKEAYEKANSKVTIEINQSDSTNGMNSTVEGICDIGMASRELKQSELDKGLKNTVIALDGIAVVVNKSNKTENMTLEQVKDIYVGNVTTWSQVEKA